jgi:alpha-glucosidase (family GH31 glycosyl hydrolase)
LDTPIQKINVHVRGGFIIPMQIPGPNLILGRGNPFQLLVALSSSGNASGNLFWDDGDSIGMHSFILILLSSLLFLDNLDPIGTKSYNYLEFTLTSAVS